MKDVVTQSDSLHSSGVGQKQQQQAAPQSGKAMVAPSHEDIARKAYDIYERSGQKQGQCTKNWQQAETELSR